MHNGSVCEKKGKVNTEKGLLINMVTKSEIPDITETICDIHLIVIQFCQDIVSR